MVAIVNEAMEADSSITYAWIVRNVNREVSAITIKKYLTGGCVKPNIELCRSILDAVQGKIEPKLLRLEAVSQRLKAIAS